MSWQNFFIPSAKELLSFENSDFLSEDISRYYHFQFGSARIFIDVDKKTGKYCVKVYGRFDGWHSCPVTYWSADSLQQAINIFHHYIATLLGQYGLQSEYK